MAQNDIVLGLGRPMYGTSVHANRKKAYPSVITTLGQMEKEARQWIAIHNFMCRGIGHANQIKKQYLNVLCADSAEKLDDPDERRLYVAHGIKASFGNRGNDTQICVLLLCCPKAVLLLLLV